MEEKKVLEATVIKEEKEKEEDKDKYQEDKAISYLSYLGIFCLVPLLIKKDSIFAQFHAKQGLVLAIGWILGGFFYHFVFLGLFLHLAIIILSIQGLLAISRGEMKKLPIVSDLAEKINF